jgi:hypothetical protein
MPAPAPWAKTKQARGCAGRVRNAETETEVPTSIVSRCALSFITSRGVSRHLVFISSHSAPRRGVGRPAIIQHLPQRQLVDHHFEFTMCGLDRLSSVRRRGSTACWRTSSGRYHCGFRGKVVIRNRPRRGASWYFLRLLLDKWRPAIRNVPASLTLTSPHRGAFPKPPRNAMPTLLRQDGTTWFPRKVAP